MADDISSRTVLVLVLLTLSVSLVGTFAVTSELSKIPAVQQEEPVSSGEVKLEITSPEEQQRQQQKLSGDGRVAIEIVEGN